MFRDMRSSWHDLFAMRNLLYIALLLETGYCQSYTNITTLLAQYSDLSTFATILNQYPAVFDRISASGVTVLAPTNDAIAAVLGKNPSSSDVSADVTEALLWYHVLEGSHASGTVGTEFIPTLLTDIHYSNVTGGQRVEVRRSGGDFYVLSGMKSRSNVISADHLFAGNEDASLGLVHIIDKVLTIPTDELTTVSLPAFSGYVQLSVSIPPDERLGGVDGAVPDWTFFAPNSSDLDWASLSIPAAYAAEGYHFVRSQVKYSTDLVDGMKLQTVEGRDVTITVLNGSIYVNAAKIIQPDYLISTGVIHMIDVTLDLNDTSARPAGLNSSSTNPAATSNHESHSSGLSAGAKAGIGIGCIVGVGLILTFIFFYVRRQRRSRGLTELPEGEKDSAMQPLQHMTSTSELHHEPPTYELDVKSKRPAELDAAKSRRLAELQG